MSDIFSTPTQPEPMFTDPPSADKANGGKKPRKKRTARKPPASSAAGGQAAPVASSAAVAPKKRGRPPANPDNKLPRAQKAPGKKVPTPVEGETNINLLLGATVGLDSAETQFVASVLTALQGNGKKSRAKITAALGRIFT